MADRPAPSRPRRSSLGRTQLRSQRKRPRPSQKEAHCKQRALDNYRKALSADDDSDREGAEPEHYDLLGELLTKDPDVARGIKFQWHGGCFIAVDGFDSNGIHGGQHTRISDVVAMVFCDGVEAAKCRGLQRGTFGAFGAVEKYQLQTTRGRIILVAAHKQAELGQSGYSFYNPLDKRWLPISLVLDGPYTPVEELLYVAFTPQPNGTLFVKAGYREIGKAAASGDSDRALIGYLEHKCNRADLLQLTNRPDAGVFIMPIPPRYACLERSGKAAEKSLCYELANSGRLKATPTGNNAEKDAFSDSLEYFFVEAAASRDRQQQRPLEALAAVLREFSGNAALMPQRAIASGGGPKRRGRKRLVSWGETLYDRDDRDEEPRAGRRQTKPKQENLVSRAKRDKLAAKNKAGPSKRRTKG
eukprot:TRINITY_DN59584_c0_g1_i1.p1 TRINITY_DN59584_c0_g1~~TRINITY_DN59584_c0_g1_i1.p1  ORF type:complete len:416 (-),score=77.12 TRINITY_DN59584_c0_g1_i1:238-1485(-)